jgi:plasmid stabilization system protein ParE
VKEVRYLAPAVYDLQRAVDRLEKGSNSIVRGFIAEYLQTLEQLRVFPEMAPIASSPVRKMILRNYPFSILYYLKDDHIVIVALVHHRQHPDSWRGRVAD